jgi:DNA-binding TFAR19-related protein (PDSD5 family)
VARQGEDDNSARKALMKRMREQQVEAQKKEILKRFLTDDALERVLNVRISNPEVYNRFVDLVISLVQSNRLSGKITNEQVVEILTKFTSRQEPKIEFRHK